MEQQPRVKFLKATYTKPWYYDAPQVSVDAGVIERKTFATLEEANAYAVECRAKHEAYLAERRRIKSLAKNARVGDVVAAYLINPAYTTLAESTRNAYKETIDYWQDAKVGGVPLMKAKLDDISVPSVQHLYDKYSTRSIVQANRCISIFRLIVNFAIRQGYTRHNPFASIKTITPKKRSVIWTRSQIRAFLNTAYSQYKWRSLGLIVHMAYEWGQRLGDMRNLKWENFDLETGVLTLTQSKRGASVKLPTSEGLHKMLKEQYKLTHSRGYIAPNPRRVRNRFVPYDINQINRIGRTIMNEAELPEELQLMDMRRTAVTEMVENGVPITSIMQVTGHTSPSSLAPYVKHTLKGATYAQSQRNIVSMV